jgi:chloramphenicol 3-O phosphotransferase
MHHAIAALSRCGNNVLADHVLVEPDWVVECAQLFVGLPAYLVGVRCPLDVLEERERSRRDRTLGQARKQFELVHAHGVYDLEVDTSTEDVDECVRRIVAMLAAPPRAFGALAGRS